MSSLSACGAPPQSGRGGHKVVEGESLRSFYRPLALFEPLTLCGACGALKKGCTRTLRGGEPLASPVISLLLGYNASSFLAHNVKRRDSHWLCRSWYVLYESHYGSFDRCQVVYDSDRVVYNFGILPHGAIPHLDVPFRAVHSRMETYDFPSSCSRMIDIKT